MRFTAALLVLGFAACAAPAFAGEDGPPGDVRLAACDAIGDSPTTAQVKACAAEAMRFVEAHRDMIEKAQREIRANQAAIEDARDEIRANADAIRDAARQIRESADELHQAAQALRAARPDQPPPPDDSRK